MDDGEQQPDIDPNIQVAKDKGAIPSADIAPEIEKSTEEGKIFSTKENEQFPVGIQHTQFYKDAVKDGWSFISRKLLPDNTPFKTLPSLDLKDIEKLNYKDLKNKDKIEPTKKRGRTLPRIDFQQFRKHTYITEQNTMKNTKLKKAKLQIAKLIIEQTLKLPQAKPDVSRLVKLLTQYIDNPIEYSQLLVAISEYDVPGKKRAINMAFAKHPALKSAFLTQFGDEDDTTSSFSYKGVSNLGMDEPEDSLSDFGDEEI